MFWAYMLRCSDGRYYTGHTDNLESRVAQHQSGAIKGYTHKRRPIELVWSETFPTRAEALGAELQIRNWSRAKKEALIAANWERLKIAAIPPAERSTRASASLGTSPRLRSGRTEGASTPPSSIRVERSPDNFPSVVERSREGAPSPPPAIVLVRPQLGENIGKAARAMLNFGLVDLRLVAPRDGWPNPAAFPAAAGADEVLERARIFASLGEAIADCAHVYATTVRRRGVVKPVLDADQAARAIRGAPERSAVVFGPERSGLEADEVAAARAIITVPINPEFGSLNLAQAVILLAYEWSKGENLAQPPAIEPDPPADQAELDGLVAHLEGALEQARYFFPPARAPASRRTLRSLLTKPRWTAKEIRTLRGVIGALANPRPRR